MRTAIKTYGTIIFAISVVFSCNTKYEITATTAKTIDYSAAVPDSGLAQTIKPYKQTQDSLMAVVVGYLGENMEKGFPEGTLGNLIADILFETVVNSSPRIFNAQNTFSLINNGGLRIPLQQGAVTRGKVFELMPFENTVVVVSLTGKSIVEGMVPYLLSKKGQPLSSNVSVVFRQNKLKQFLVNQQPIDTAAIYNIITSDYLAGGGDNMIFFKDQKQLIEVEKMKLRDCIIAYFQKYSSLQKPLMAGVFGRIIYEMP